MKLVYDSALEKRCETHYQTVTETVMKPVCKTLYRDEPTTLYKTCTETGFRPVQKPCPGRSPRRS